MGSLADVGVERLVRSGSGAAERQSRVSLRHLEPTIESALEHDDAFPGIPVGSSRDAGEQVRQDGEVLGLAEEVGKRLGAVGRRRSAGDHSDQERRGVAVPLHGQTQFVESIRVVGFIHNPACVSDNPATAALQGRTSPRSRNGFLANRRDQSRGQVA